MRLTLGVFYNFIPENNRTWSSHSLELPEPGVGHDGPQDRGQVAESHEHVVDGGGQVIVPVKEVGEVQHEDSCEQQELCELNNRIYRWGTI